MKLLQSKCIQLSLTHTKQSNPIEDFLANFPADFCLPLICSIPVKASVFITTFKINVFHITEKSPSFIQLAVLTLRQAIKHKSLSLPVFMHLETSNNILLVFSHFCSFQVLIRCSFCTRAQSPCLSRLLLWV